MAKIIGAITTSHIPAIGGAIAKGQQNEPYWKPFFDGYGPVHDWLDRTRPDVAVVFYNDHGLNFFLDKMPTFAIGAAAEYHHADEGWALPVMPSFPGDPTLSWHLIEALVEHGFDMTVCQEMLVDHAFAIPMALLWPGAHRPVRTIPVAINTVLHPLPSPKRCFALGHAIGQAIEAYAPDVKVLIVGTGGLSHQLDGTRAGFINKPFDLQCMDDLVSDPTALTTLSVRQIVELAGSQGTELLNLIAARGALTGEVSKVYGHYHVPISNTATGLLVLEQKPPVPRGVSLAA